MPVPEEICDPKERTDCESTCQPKDPLAQDPPPGDGKPTGEEKIACGGLAGLQCPNETEWECVDDDTDDCGPMAADCPGICVRKGRL